MPDKPDRPGAKGADVPERITRAIVAAKEQWAQDHPDRPDGFTIRRAIEAARAQWRLERPQRSANGRDLVFDAIVTACGGDLSSITRPYGAQVATAKRDILEATPEVTAEEVMRRARAYKAKYRDAALTPLSLSKHWPEFSLSPEARTRAAQQDNYVEPAGWQNVLMTIARREGWDMETVMPMRDKPWLDLSLNVRQKVLKVMNP